MYVSFYLMCYFVFFLSYKCVFLLFKCWLSPLAWGNLGNVLKNQGKMAEAEKAYRNALHYRGNMADMLYNLWVLAKCHTFILCRRGHIRSCHHMRKIEVIYQKIQSRLKYNKNLWAASWNRLSAAEIKLVRESKSVTATDLLCVSLKTLYTFCSWFDQSCLQSLSENRKQFLIWKGVKGAKLPQMDPRSFKPSRLVLFHRRQ